MSETEGAGKRRVIVFQDSQEPGEVVRMELTKEGTRLSRLERTIEGGIGEEIEGSVVHGRKKVEKE